jgi:hypothetical protein
VAPYLWLPTIGGELRYDLPPALGGSASIEADAGGYFRGDPNLTWQGFTGIGSRTGWGGVQLGWRQLSYDQGGPVAGAGRDDEWRVSRRECQFLAAPRHGLMAG